MDKKIQLDWLWSLCAGIALVFAFSPAHFIWLTVLCPAILYGLLIRQKPKAAALLGFLFGFGFFATGASWVFISIYVFGGTSLFISAAITLLFVSALSCFYAFLGFLLQRYFPTKGLCKALLVYPALWALSEALRAHLLSGFPWLMLGQAATDSVFSGFVPIFGAYGTSFLLVLTGSLFFLAVMPHYDRPKLYGWQLSNLCLFSLLLLVCSSVVLGQISFVKPFGAPLSVSLVQGNIPQSLRWEKSEVEHILDTYQGLTQGHYQSNLIVWPEAAIPVLANQAGPFIQEITDELSETGSSLITGIPYELQHQDYNAVLGLGKAQGLYSKRHLVPFGEYVPYEQYLRGLIQFFNLPMSNFIPGAPRQPLLTVQGIPVAVYICYEVAYGWIVRQDLPAARLLITVSDDAWFGKSFAPWQHMQIGQFTALETGRQMLFVGNNGLTAIINNKGQIQSLLPQFTANVLTGSVTEYIGATPWVRIGDLPWLILMLVIVGLCYLKRKKNN